MPNVKSMKLMGAEVVRWFRPRTLKDAINESIKRLGDKRTDTLLSPWNRRRTASLSGDGGFLPRRHRPRSACLFQQGSLPDYVVACVGGGSNAMGIFSRSWKTGRHLVGVEAGGRSLGPGDNAATLSLGRRGIFQGALSYLLQDANCQVQDVHSVSAGLDYAGIGPQHSFLKDTGRVRYTSILDEQALAAFHELTRLEGLFRPWNHRTRWRGRLNMPANCMESMSW